MSLYVGSSVRDEAKIVQAKYDSLKEWKYDPKGYFLIRINLKTREIEAGYCRRNNEVELVVKGKHPEELYATIVMESKLNLVSLKEHAAYLGMELEVEFGFVKGACRLSWDGIGEGVYCFSSRLGVCAG